MKYYSAALLALMSLLTIGSPAAYSQEVRLDLGSVINNIFSPPHRTAEINAKAEIEKERLRQQAEVEKAKIAAEATKNIDRVAPVLTKWGVNRVNCAPGVAFINGLSTDTVCINPTGSIAAGYYNYSPDRQLLVRVETNNAPTAAPAANVAKVETHNASTAVSATTGTKNADRGF
jgi:hypothetical protein